MSKRHEPGSDVEARVDRLFSQIAALDTEEAMAFLESVKETDEVKARLIELIRADSDPLTGSGEFVLSTQADFSRLFSVDQPAPDLCGQNLDGLVFQRRIASGGMGDVYLAEDTRLHRPVAIKIIRDAFRFDQRAKERFRREAQILSRLDHRGICRIFNLIESEALDYLVLEYVDGQTLRSWLETRPSFRRRREVAAALLSALSAAHEQGVVHRDLKPDNIMIQAGDQVKILDFGISRFLSHAAISEPDSAASPGAAQEPDPIHQTHSGALLGTVEYMSPEQARGEPVGTASDVYSLGLLFQAIFSDTPPQTDYRNTKVVLATSSNRLTHSLTGVTRELQRLVERMKLDAPAARPTAVEASGALERIRLRPQRRLRFLFASALVLIAVAAGIKYTLDLRHERSQANQARIEAEQVSDFLISLFNVSDPNESRGSQVTARELLDQSARTIDSELAAQPVVLGRLKNTMGRVYLKLGLYDAARQQLHDALELSSANALSAGANYLDTLIALGNLEFEASEYATAETWFERALDEVSSSAEDEEALLEIKDGLAQIYARTDRLEQALKFNQQVLTAREQAVPLNELEIARANNNVGIQYWRLGQLPEAELHVRRAQDGMARAKVEDLSFEATILSNFSLILSDQGKFEEAAGSAQDAVAIRERIHGEGHPFLALAYDNLAVAQFRAGLLEEAERSNLKALELYAQTDGKQHANYAWTLANRAVVLREKGDYDGSIAALQEVIDTMTATFGETHSSVAENESKLAGVYLLQGRPAEAEKHGEKTLAIYRALEADMSPFISRSWFQLADIQKQLGKPAAARQTLEELLVLLRANPEIESSLIEQAEQALRDLPAPPSV